MDQLPQELLRHIVQNVDYKCLEPLRLVNKAFAATAAPFLFKDIPLWIGVRSLERLTAISEHPELSKCPKRLFFSPLRFIEYQPDNLYEDKVDRMMKRIGELRKKPASPSVHALTLVKHMSTYRSYTEAQRLLSLNGLDVEILSKAFSQLPHLESLYIDSGPSSIGSAELIRAFGLFRAGDLLTCDCCDTLPVLVQALAALPNKLKVFKLDSYGDEYRGHSGNSGDFSSSMPHIYLCQGDRINPIGLSAKALLNTFCAENLATYTNAFRGLRELRIGFIDIPLHEISNFPTLVVALRDLMQCALGLEMVTLYTVEGSAGAQLIPPSLDNVMPSYGFNNLKELTLWQYSTTVVALRDLFSRNRYTIARVEFQHVSITRSDWSTALLQLRKIDLLRLEFFELNFCNGREKYLEVQDYILKKTDRDPIVEDRARRSPSLVSSEEVFNGEIFDSEVW